MKLWAGILIILFLSITSDASPSSVGRSEVRETTRQFLDAYAHGDLQMVLTMVGPSVVVYGSDLAEVFTGKAGVEKMLKDDMRLWNGSAEIGDMKQVSLVEKGDFASIFFNATFRLAKREPMPVRFAMVWQRSKQGWKLVQSSNSVPTQGQSAERLLQH